MEGLRRVFPNFRFQGHGPTLVAANCADDVDAVKWQRWLGNNLYYQLLEVEFRGASQGEGRFVLYRGERNTWRRRRRPS